MLSFGVMGGQYQAMGQVSVLSNMLDYGMDIQAALDSPRFFLYEGELATESSVPAPVREALQTLGHQVVVADAPHGGGQGISIDWHNGTLTGGSDPRKDGMAAGY